MIKHPKGTKVILKFYSKPLPYVTFTEQMWTQVTII